MAAHPEIITVSISPSARYETIDIRERVASQAGDVLEEHGRSLYCSLHTTAGYLEQSLAARLHHRHERLSQFFDAFRALFPAGRRVPPRPDSSCATSSPTSSARSSRATPTRT